MDQYANFLIKEYTHWDLYLHENQGYLGRCYLWSKRREAASVTDATPEEWTEVLTLFRAIESGLKRAFNTDKFNYSFLGNETPHMHCHVIPRYDRVVMFGGIAFSDPLWGKNYQTDPNFKIPPYTQGMILAKMRDVMG